MYNTQEQFPHGPKMPPVATAFLDKNMSIHVDIQSSSQLGGGERGGQGQDWGDSCLTVPPEHVSTGTCD